MTYEEWKNKKDKERYEASEKQTAVTEKSPSKAEGDKKTGGYEAWKRRRQTNARSTAADRVNQWLSEVRRFSDAYTARYKDGNQKYRTDSAYWLENATKSRNLMRDMALDIGKYMEENRHILGDDFIAQATDMIREGRKFQSSVVDQAQREKDYYSQWENEDAYNADMKKREEYEAKRSFDTKAGRQEVAQLENALKEYRSLSRWETDEKGRSRLEELKKQYGDEKGIRDLITQKSAYLTEAERIQKGDRLSGVGQLGSELYDPEIRFVKADVENQDVQYRYINDENYRREYQQMLGGNYDNLKEAGLEYLTEDEKRTYNYYYAKGGKEQAQEYLKSIREQLNYRRADEMYEGLEDNTLLEMAFGIEAGIDQWQSGMSSLINNWEGDYMAPSARQIASGMVREDLGERSKFAQGAYDLVTTTANMAPSILTSTVANILAPGSGTFVGSAMMGASASGSAYQEMINQGYSKEQARAYGTLVGASETVLGSLLGGISSLGGHVSGHVIQKAMNKADNVIFRVATKVLGNMASEGFEEATQEALTPWFKSLLTGEEYAAAPEDVLYAGLLGALSAGFLEGPTSVMEAHGVRQQGLELQAANIAPERLAKIGQTFSADTVAYQLAGRVGENTDAYTMGRLFNEIDAELTQLNKDSITSALMSKGMEERHARKLAEGFAAVVTGTPLTEDQANALVMNDVLAQTVREVIIDPNSTVNQRSQGFNEVLRTLAEGGTEAAPEVNPEVMPTAMETEDAAPENQYEAPADGKTILKTTGETVGIRDIAESRSGKLRLNLEDGRTVDAEDVSFGSEGEAMVYSAVAEMNVHPKVANVLMENYRLEDTDAEVYAKGIQEAYRFGENNYPMSMAAKGPFTSLLTPRQRDVTYQMGQVFGGKQVAKAQAIARTTAVKNTGPGKVRFDGDRTALSERQQVSLNALDRVASALGVQIHIFDSKSNRELAKKNGWFDPSDNSIHIDLYAGEQGKSTMLFTASHELTHFVKKWSPEKFKVLSDFLMQEYGKQDDVIVDELVQKQVKIAKEDGRELTQEQAFEEVIANSMEAMLSDGNVIEKLEKLKAQDRSLWEKIRDYVKDLAAKIKKVYEGIRPDSEEGKYVAEMKDAIEQIQNLFAEGLSEAGSNYQAAMERGEKTQKNTADEGGEVMYSLRQFKDGTRFVDVQTDQDLFTGLSDTEMNSLAKKIIRQRFVGRVIGIDNRVFVNGDSAHEYVFPSKKIPADIRNAKLRASAELDNLLDAGTNFRNAPDGADGHHHANVTDGFDYFDTIFKVGDEYYSGVINIMNIKRGKLLKDITKIRNITKDIISSYGTNPKSDFLRDASMNSIRGSDRDVNQKFSERTGEGVSSRAMLADAFESLAKTDLERKKVQEYREKAAQYDAEEQKLRELRGQIKELSFAKGPRDKEKLRALRDEATKTANRINIYDKQLLRLEASAPLQAVLEREKARTAARMKKQRKEATDEYREGRNKTALRHKIQNFKKKMEATLLHPTDSRYAPASLIGAMVEVCNLIDTDTDLYKADGSINKAQQNRNLTKEKLRDLKDEYEKLKKADPVYAGEFDEMIYAYIADIQENYSGRSLNEMSLDELRELYENLKAIDETLIDARKLIGWGEAEGVYEAGDAIIAEQGKITADRKNGRRSGVGKALDGGLNLSLSPVRNVERMSGYNQDSVLLKLFKRFEQGVRKKNKFIMDSYKGFEHLTGGKEYEDAIYKPTGKKYRDVNGREFSVSKMQMMQAVLSFERETANGMEHIQKGGFNFADLKMLEKGRLQEAISEEYSHRLPAAMEVVAEFQEELKGDKWCQAYMVAARKFFNETAKNAINETMMVLKHRIVAKDKNYIPFEVDKNFVVREITEANEIQKTINSYGMLAEIRKGSPQPLIITGLNNILDRHIEQVGSVYGLAVEVRNFNKVWNMKSQNSPNSDPTVKAAVERNWGKGGAKHIEQAVQDIQGPRVNKQSTLYRKIKSGYINSTFLLNLSVVTKQIGSLFAATSMIKWRGPVRMMGNLVATMANQKKISAEVDKYTASAWMRRQGLSDAELHSFMTQAKRPGLMKAVGKLPAALNPGKWISGMDHTVALSLWKYAKEDTARRTGLKGEALLQATAGFYDEVIENTQSMSDMLHRPEVQKRSDVVSEALGMFKTDLYQMAGQIQVTAGRMAVNNTEENRRAMGRTVYAVAMSAVWGQLMTTVFALLRYKVNQYRDEEDKDLTMESWLKRQGFALAGDFTGYIFPLLGSEAMGFIENIVYGESEDIVDNLALTAANDLYKTIVDIASKLKDGEELKLSDYRKISTKALQVFGIPLNNVLRILDAIHLHAQDIANGEFLSFEAGINRTNKQHLHRIAEAMDEGRMDVAQALFLEALEESAMEKADGGEFTEDDLKEARSGLKTALGEKYKDGETSRDLTIRILEDLFGENEEDIHWIMEKWDYARENGSADDYTKYSKFYEAVRTGIDLKKTIAEYTSNGVKKETLSSQMAKYFRDEYVGMDQKDRNAIRGYIVNGFVYCGMDREDAAAKVSQWDVEAEYGIDYEERYDAYLAGKISAKDMEKILTGTAGMSPEAAGEKIAALDAEKQYGFAYEDRRAAYRDGKITEKQLKEALMGYGGMTEAEAARQIKVYDWQNEGIDISSDQIGVIEDYETYCEPMRISREIYWNAYLHYKESGSSAKNSKVKECMPYIDSLPLTAAQKTALALCWWAESTVKRYKSW